MFVSFSLKEAANFNERLMHIQTRLLRERPKDIQHSTAPGASKWGLARSRITSDGHVSVFTGSLFR